MQNEKAITTKDKLVTLAVATVAVILVISAIIIVNYLVNLHDEANPVTVIPTPSEYPDYDAIKGLNPDQKIKKIEITLNCPNKCTNDQSATADFDGIEKNYRAVGKFSRAYVYADVAVDYKRPLTSWDDLYLRIGGFGGHIILDENLLPVPAGQSSRYLFNMKSISYYSSLANKTAKKSSNNIDFFSVLQNENEFHVHASISSNRPGRVMREISIYYECLDGSQCYVEEVK
jgi:hypothetical protein